MERLPETGDDAQVLVVGEEAAKGLAAHMADERDVRLLSDDEDLVRTADSGQFEARHVGFDADGLEQHGSDADTAVVVTERDRVGLLVTRLLNATCGIDQILVRVDDPKNRAAFEDVDCQVIETGPLLQPEVERMLAPADD